MKNRRIYLPTIGEKMKKYVLAKKYVLVSLVVAVLASLGIILAKYINDAKTLYCFNIEGYTTAYITGEVQEYTHDLTVAKCKIPKGDMAYIEVPEVNPNASAIVVRYDPSRETYYHVEDTDNKVYNYGFIFENWK